MMLITEPRFDRTAENARRCVLCAGPLKARPPHPPGRNLGEFCDCCVEQEFADDALELWSWFCGPAERLVA